MLGANKRSFFHLSSGALIRSDSGIMPGISGRDCKVCCPSLALTKNIEKLGMIQVVRDCIASIIATFDVKIHGSWVPINIAGERHAWQ